MKLTSHNKIVPICIAALVSLIIGLSARDHAAAGQETKRVFVLHSYHQGYPVTDNETRGIFDVFGKSDIKVETYVTYMDAKRIPVTAQHFAQIKELIKKGYKGVRFDAVLVCDNDALELIRKYRDELFPKVPVVFSGIDDFSERMLDGRKDITGVTENADYASTVRIALKLRPVAKNIVVVTDNTTTGKAHRSEIEKIRPAFPPSLAFTYLSLADTTLDELAQTLSRLKSDSIVLLVQHFVDKNGASHALKESASLLSKSASVPVFVTTDSRMGLGVLGGRLIGGYFQGETAAQMVLKILKGTDVSSIPIAPESPNRYMFDHTVMLRFKIAESDLPPESILINNPVSILDVYRPHLIIIAGTFIFLSGILVYLLLEIRQRKKIEETLTLTRVSVEAASDALFWMTPDSRIVDVNKAACRSLGYTREELLQLHVPDVDVNFNRETWKQHFPELRKHGSLIFESAHRTKDGRVFPVEIVANYVNVGTSERDCAFVRDITDRKQAGEEQNRLQAQLLQAQKMESVGTLAGGIAHDFNNILSAIIGYGNLALMKMSKDDPQRLNIEHILEAGGRAAHLTKDLLLFSRKQISERKPVDLNDVVRKVEKFLGRVIGEDIECRTMLIEGALPILGDAHQLEQVLMNLATNARDAMTSGGIFSMTTSRVKFNDKFTSEQEKGKPGSYALITVSDTGVGMDATTREHIFEPFFTTKEVGRGTGLGLSVVFGIIKQHDGFVDVYSEQGQGSTFKVYLPLTSAGVELERMSEEEPPRGGTETILFAEDDEAIRNLNCTVLENFGYTVIMAIDGQDAVDKYRERKDRIHLLLFDIIMPRKSGKEAYDEIRTLQHDTKVLFQSGYAPDMIRKKVLLEDKIPVIFKPVSPMMLLKQVRSILDQAT